MKAFRHAKESLKARLLKNWPKLEISAQADLKDYFHLTFTLTCGIIITILLFIFSLKTETEKFRSEFAVNSDTLGFNLDLLISNQTIRMQNFEDDLQNAVVDVEHQRHFIDAVLRSSSFTSLYYVSIAGIDDQGLPELKRRLRFDLEKNAVPIPKTLNLDPNIKNAVSTMMESNIKSIPLFFQKDGVNIFSLIWRTSNKAKRYFIFAGPTEKLIPPNALMTVGLNIVIEQLSDNTFWLLTKTATNKINLNQVNAEDLNPLRTHRHLNRVYYPRFSSDFFKFEILRNDFTEHRFFWPLILLGSGIAITCLFSFIIFSLINRNIEVQQLVTDKTAHLELESQKALDAAFAKTRFLANVSHEIRTPLNMILGMADLLKETKLSSKQHEYVDNFKNAGSHLLNLIDDILDMARIDSDEVKFKYERVHLLSLIEEVCHLVSLPCHNKGLQFYCNVDPQIPSYVNIDPSRLRQILINLINNSIKFTEHGFIELDVKLLRSGPITTQVSRVEFSVRDSGMGIPEEAQKDIFRAFYQVNPTITRAKSGVGLGLSIVNAIVTRFNGSIRVASKEREGSVFSVEIPLNVIEARPWIGRFNAHGSAPRKALIVSDDEQTSQMLLSYMRALNIETDLIKPDAYRLEHLKNILAPYEIAIIDSSSKINRYNLPNSFDGLPPRMRVILIESLTASELRQLPTDKTMNTVKTLRKPVLPTSFFNALGFEEAQSAAEAHEAVAHSPQPAAVLKNIARDLSLLIVDDDAGNRLLLKAYLEGFNWDVRYAVDGLEALRMCEQKRPEIMVADLQMPVMDGFTMVQRLRQDQSARGEKPSKVIILTADALAETAEQARQLDIHVYLTKPIRKTEFLGSIAQLLDDDDEPSRGSQTYMN